MFKMNSPEYKGAEFNQIIETNIRQTLLQEVENRRTMRGTMKGASLMSSSNMM
jgi:hypothetical protein